jgi:type IV secretion system protein VirD4
VGFLDGVRRGRDEALASYAAERSASPQPKNEPPRPPSPRGEPSPIRIGYYLDEKKRVVGRPNLFYGERHILIFGLNGAGKSTRFLIELLMTTCQRSLFIFDIKGELAFQTAAERRRYGAVKIINPYGVLGMPSDGFNPLAQLEPGPLLYDKAAAIADALIEIEAGPGQFWSESAQGLIVALIMWEVIVARGENRTPSLFNVRMRLTEGNEYENYIDAEGKPRKRLVKGLGHSAARMMESGNSTIASLAGRFVREHGQNELAGIQSTADTATQWMLADPMRIDLEKNGTDLRELHRRPTTVFVVLPPQEITRKRAWTRMLVAAGLAVHFEPGPVRTLFILDEFRAAVGSMTIINDMWSLVRGYGVQLMPILQSALQLQSLFKEEWENYAAQAGLVATVGPAGDSFTANWMSERCGVTTILKSSLNLSDGFNDGASTNMGSGIAASGTSSNQGQGSSSGRSSGGAINYSQTERRAFLPQELRSLKNGHGRIWLPGMGADSIPFFAPNYWKRRAEWVKRVKPNPYRGR